MIGKVSSALAHEPSAPTSDQRRADVAGNTFFDWLESAEAIVVEADEHAAEDINDVPTAIVVVPEWLRVDPNDAEGHQAVDETDLSSEPTAVVPVPSISWSASASAMGVQGQAEADGSEPAPTGSGVRPVMNERPGNGEPQQPAPPSAAEKNKGALTPRAQRELVYPAPDPELPGKAQHPTSPASAEDLLPPRYRPAPSVRTVAQALPSVSTATPTREDAHHAAPTNAGNDTKAGSENEPQASENPAASQLGQEEGQQQRGGAFREAVEGIERDLELLLSEDDPTVSGFRPVPGTPGLYEIEHPSLGVVRVRFEAHAGRHGVHIEVSSEEAAEAIAVGQWKLRQALREQGFELLSIGTSRAEQAINPLQDADADANIRVEA